MANDVAIQNQTQGATGTTQEITEVKAYPFFDVEKRKFRYNFKTEYAQDESEKNIKESAIKRDGIDLELPVPSVQTLIEKLTLRDKEAELIVEGIHQVIFNQGRILINKILEEDKVEYNPEAPEGVKKATYSINLTPEMIDLNKLSLSYIANLPPAERRGGGIAKETWDGFVGDYKDVMASYHKQRHEESVANHAHNPEVRIIEMKTPEQINNAAQQFFYKFNKCKTNKTVL